MIESKSCWKWSNNSIWNRIFWVDFSSQYDVEYGRELFAVKRSIAVKDNSDSQFFYKIYKWANLKNCTKLHCEFHKWIKIITFLCALKKITILFQLNGITDFVISSFKRTEPTSTHCTHEMCQWHKQPVPFDSLCRAYLIAVQCQFLLTLAEKYFNRPSTHIPGKNLLCR